MLSYFPFSASFPARACALNLIELQSTGLAIGKLLSALASRLQNHYTSDSAGIATMFTIKTVNHFSSSRVEYI